MQALRQADQPGLAAALRQERSSRDILATVDEETRRNWREQIETDAKGSHPILRRDNIKYKNYRFYRLTSMTHVNVTDLDWRQLVMLLRITLTHIEAGYYSADCCE